ncbi:MAG TPA: hypothetical protein VKG82_09160 [Solirubrobacteraceae bacterium]|nr:hypothetical protein [Solirubrobacteraceae bacterium]
MALPPLAELPALPLHSAGKYVAAAYVVLFALVLIYVAIMALRMSRIERELGELLAETDSAKEDPRASSQEDAPPLPSATSTAASAAGASQRESPA